MRWTLQKERIGEVLVSLGLISRSQLQLALAEQRDTGERLGEALVRLGFIRRKDLNLVLSEQYRRAFAGALGMGFIFLNNGAALASPKATLTLTGTVAPRSTVRVANASAPVAVDLSSPVVNAPLTSLVSESNGRHSYSVILESQSAATTGKTMLMAADQSQSIPYSLSYGGKAVRFEGASAVLKSSARASDASGADLAISTARAAPSNRGFNDVLSVVIRAD